MKNKFTLILSVVIVLTLAACTSQSRNETFAADSTTKFSDVSADASTSRAMLAVVLYRVAESTEAATILRNYLSVKQLTPESTPAPESSMTNINITVGNSTFTAKLHNNSTTKALLEQFPMTLNMSELNGNEKFYYLSKGLPTDSGQVGNIKNGDLMLYGSDCLVLFYESFSTAYSYTKLGYIENASGLASALGSGSVEVIFSVSGK